ncbi:MAG: hypothetical protein M3Y81_10810 [Chloroflexota bacterium]|nr:hypothetical protein [Chloroflexota bacterium]
MDNVQPSTQPETNAAPNAKWKVFVRSLAPSLFINGVCPFIIYILLKNYTHASDFLALLLTGVPSLIDSIIGIIRSRRIDLLAGATLLGIAVSLILIGLGGSPRWLLVRESFLTFAFGVAFLGSLLFPKPLGFYTARQFLAGRGTKRIAWFERLWQHASFRTIVRIQTIIWGVCLVLEAVIRVSLVFILSIEQFLVVSPFILYGLIGLTIVASGLFMRFWQKGHQDEALENEMKTLWSPAAQAHV